MVSAAVPVLVIVRACEPELPTTALPKLRLVALSASAGCVPLPVREATVGVLYALLFIEMLPDALPGAAGANCALKVLDCPGARESRKFTPLTPQPPPLALPCELVNLPT